MNLNNQYLLKGLLLSGYTNMLKDLSKLNDKEIDALISSYRSSYALLSKLITYCFTIASLIILALGNNTTDLL